MSLGILGTKDFFQFFDLDYSNRNRGLCSVTDMTPKRLRDGLAQFNADLLRRVVVDCRSFGGRPRWDVTIAEPLFSRE